MLQGFVRRSAGVYETIAEPVVVEDAHIQELIESARVEENGRARLLLHAGPDDGLHEMVIALPPDSCDHPHINFKSGKSFLALSGQFAVMHCSDDGARIEPFILSAGHWPGNRLVRLQKPAWHTIIPIAGDVVFLETIVGPFTGNRFAEWFPAENEPHERALFVDRFRKLAHSKEMTLKSK